MRKPVKSKVDEKTSYIIKDYESSKKMIRIIRDDESIEISIMSIPNYKERFIPDIFEELMQIRLDIFGKPCRNCGKLFVGAGNTQFCSKECAKIGKKRATYKRAGKTYRPKKKEKRKSLIDEITLKASEQGMSYGQLKAKEYIERLRNGKQ